MLEPAGQGDPGEESPLLLPKLAGAVIVPLASVQPELQELFTIVTSSGAEVKVGQGRQAPVPAISPVIVQLLELVRVFRAETADVPYSIPDAPRLNPEGVFTLACQPISVWE
jgi:hypothetical protein